MGKAEMAKIDPFTTIVTQEDDAGNRIGVVTDGLGGYEIEVKDLGYKYAVPCTGKQLVDLAHKILAAHRRKGV